jgi:hypothetical protein
MRRQKEKEDEIRMQRDEVEKLKREMEMGKQKMWEMEQLMARKMEMMMRIQQDEKERQGMDEFFYYLWKPKKLTNTLYREVYWWKWDTQEWIRETSLWE